MEDIWQIGKQVPALAVLCWIAWKFLVNSRESAKDFTAAIDRIGNSCHEFQRDTLHRLEIELGRATTALDKNSEIFGAIKSALEKRGAVK